MVRGTERAKSQADEASATASAPKSAASASAKRPGAMPKIAIAAR